MTLPRPIPTSERGAALLTVLLLVAVMAVIAATALERLTLSTRLAANAAGVEQARFYQLAAEQLALQRIAGLTDADGAQTTLAGDWHGRTFTLPLPQGSASLTVTDGGNCFNINSLVADGLGGARAIRPQAVEQYIALMGAVGVARGDADHIAAATIDWLDDDQLIMPGGGEDAAYAAAATRTPDAPAAAASELAGLTGMTPALWQRIAPWLCALPVSDLSPINVNTVLPEQAPLLQMLLPGRLSAVQARSHIAARPAAGYGSINRFWSSPTFGATPPTGDAAGQVRLLTRWFTLRSSVRIGDVVLDSVSLIDASGPRPRVVRRMMGRAT